MWTEKLRSFLLQLPQPHQVSPQGSWSVFDQEVKNVVSAAKQDQSEIETCVDALLTLFNAENFTGLLTDRERAVHRQVLEHFEGVPFLKPRSINPQENKANEEDPVEIQKKQDLFKINKTHHRFLECDGEIAAASMAQCGLLITAVSLAKMLPHTSVWRLRPFFRWQLCLTHRAHSLYVDCFKSVETLGQAAGADSNKSEAKDSEVVQLFVELGHVLHYFHRTEEAGKLFYHAVSRSKLKLEESAILGVRTRFQVVSHAQQLLLATSGRALPSIPEEEENLAMPKIVGSFKEGHDFYERPQARKRGEDAEGDAQGIAADMTEKEMLEHQEVAKITPLHPDDLALISALSVNIKNTNPYYGLTKHHIGYYMDRLLVDTGNPIFVFRSMILLIRGRVEAQRNRVQERAFLQLQELIDQFGIRGYSSGILSGQQVGDLGSERTISTTCSDRDGTLYRCSSKYFYQVQWPAIWELKREMASECIELTMFKTALDLYEEVKDWDGVIECCTQLDRRRKAETIITELLKRDPENITLLTALGDATRDDKYLWKAWELSEHRRAGPMRSLAKLALERKEFDKVVEYFDLSVAINPLFGGDWFNLGFACMRSNNLERAGEAFTRVCQINPDDPYSWANLGACLLQLGKTRAAFNAMSQAVRNNRRSWQFWDNYFHIGVELKEITEATLSLETTINMAKSSYVLDDQIFRQFTALALEYLRGEIDGTGQDLGVPVSHKKVNSAVEETIPHCRFEGREEAGQDGAELDLGAAEEETVQWGSMEPLLGHDFELPDMFKKKEEARSKEVEALEESRVRSLERFRKRIEEILLTLTSQFVTNAQLFATCSEILGFIHGTQTAFDYRVSQLRCAQTGQWERSDDSFEYVVQILTQMAELAQTIAVAPSQPAPETATGAAAAGGSTEPPTESTRDNKKADPFYPTRNTLSLIEEAIKMSEDHMEDHVQYRKMKGMAKRLKAQLPKD